MRRALLRLLRRYARRRAPHFVIGEGYLYRWYLLPRNPLFNIYLHLICADDDDRALHDHPWINCSIVLEGGYLEHTGAGLAVYRQAGSVVFRRARTAHRIELAGAQMPRCFAPPRPRRMGDSAREFDGYRGACKRGGFSLFRLGWAASIVGYPGGAILSLCSRRDEPSRLRRETVK